MGPNYVGQKVGWITFSTQKTGIFPYDSSALYVEERGLVTYH